jgi:formylglycine-generating enzyme required for sulfatase activity
MPVPLEQFLQQLLESGLMPADEVRAIQAGLPPEVPAHGDCQGFARELVRLRKLTPYQAALVYQGKGQALVLGNYVLLDQLGRGGMGLVFKAQHRRMGRVVALKVMSAGAMKSPDAVKRFHREVQAAARLDHPNIVAAHDADEARGTHFLVMQYVEGADLSSLVKTHGPLPVEQALRCVIQAGHGLAYAHAEGVVHRDIKPANLLLDRNGTVKVLDMGLARIDVTQIEKYVHEANTEDIPDAYRWWYRALIYQEGPLHRVLLTKPLYVAMHEATVANFRKFVEATNYVTDGEKYNADLKPLEADEPPPKPAATWRDETRWRPTDDHPVVCVSWNDAKAFCDWLSRKEKAKYRLPTCAEWEFACRAGTDTRYSFGERVSDLDQHGWWKGNSSGMAHPVGQKKPNPFGLYDMHGNVAEYCADRYGPGAYKELEHLVKRDPSGPALGSERIIRGGTFDFYAHGLRSTFFQDVRQDGPNGSQDGYRVVLEIKTGRDRN